MLFILHLETNIKFICRKWIALKKQLCSDEDEERKCFENDW